MQSFLIGQSRQLILYPFRNRIYRCILEGGQVGRPALVADDYEDSLTAAAHCFAIYYAYMSQSSQIRIGCLFGKEEYQLSDPEGRMICRPELLSYRDHLIVFYVVGNGTYEICGTGIGKEWTIMFPQTFERIPVYECHVQGDRILIRVLSERDDICVWSQEKGWERMAAEDKNAAQIKQCQELSEKEAQLRRQMEKLEEQDAVLREQTEKLEEQDAVLREQTEKLEEQDAVICEQTEKLEEQDAVIREQTEKLGEQDAVIREQTKKSEEQNAVLYQKTEMLGEKDKIIESIKEQYEELMDVASQYRAEAARWRDKFLQK